MRASKPKNAPKDRFGSFSPATGSRSTGRAAQRRPGALSGCGARRAPREAAPGICRMGRGPGRRCDGRRGRSRSVAAVSWRTFRRRHRARQQARARSAPRPPTRQPDPFPAGRRQGPRALLDAAIARGGRAVAVLPNYANAHYMLALALGRNSQRISILKALADGIATRVRTHLEATLKLEPRHAEAHDRARHVSRGDRRENRLDACRPDLPGIPRSVDRTFSRAPSSSCPVRRLLKIEYANGLMLLDAGRYREQANEQYARAAAIVPADAMEKLDVAARAAPPGLTSSGVLSRRASRRPAIPDTPAGRTPSG